MSAAIEDLNVAIQSSGGALVQKGGSSFLQASAVPSMITAVQKVMRNPMVLEWAAEIKVLKGEVADDQAALEQAKVVRRSEF